ncbi:hypothetical protein BB559_007066, partial [Furculomyces boomerangus]
RERDSTFVESNDLLYLLEEPIVGVTAIEEIEEMEDLSQQIEENSEYTIKMPSIQVLKRLQNEDDKLKELFSEIGSSSRQSKYLKERLSHYIVKEGLLYNVEEKIN